MHYANISKTNHPAEAFEEIPTYPVGHTLPETIASLVAPKKHGRPKVIALHPLDVSSSSAIWDNAKRYQNGKGYFFRQCYDHFDGKCRSRMEHILIWERLHGKEVPLKCCIHHRDGDPGNNNAENLMSIPKVLHHELHARLKSAQKSISDLAFEVERQHITQKYERMSAELMDLWEHMEGIQ